jgi:hypothetical protein
MAAREAAASERKGSPPAPADPERETRRQTLQLARARALQDLQIACDKRHRALLQQTIEHLDAELNRLSPAPPAQPPDAI